MKVLGIAAEYNPFHNGHRYHIEQSMEITGADHVVAVMSGSFVQRGEPALMDKWTRAGLAIAGGVDLVIELPFAYACNGASMFAKGAVALLEGLGVVDYMSFGSETGDVSLLRKAVARADDMFKDPSRSYAENMGQILEECGIQADSNNILAIEYLKELVRIDSHMEPVTILRADNGYASDQPAGDMASASFIRNEIIEGREIDRYVPYQMPEVLSLDDPVKEKLFNIVMSRLLVAGPSTLDHLPSSGEGIGYKLKKEMRKADSLDSLIDLVRGKRYTKARIRRVLIQAISGLYEMPGTPMYARILAFNDKGAELLRMIKKNECARSGIKVITNINKEEIDDIYGTLRFDIVSNDLYNLIAKKNLYENSDMTKRPVKL